MAKKNKFLRNVPFIFRNLVPQDVVIADGLDGLERQTEDQSMCVTR